MAKVVLTFTPQGTEGITCTLRGPGGDVLTVAGTLRDDSPETSGHALLQANPALVSNLWAYAKSEKLARRSRDPRKRKHLRARAREHASIARAIVTVLDNLNGDTTLAWCSSCFTKATHNWASGPVINKPTAVCGACGSLTSRCPAPGCRAMAVRTPANAGLLRYCAEHRHDLPSFVRATERIETLADYEELLRYDSRNLSRGSKITVAAVAAAAAAGTAGLAAAPAVGGAIGSMGAFGGLSGAAATSHGLAILGGGAVAAGGLGMAAGTAVVVATGTVLGSGLGAWVANSYVGEDKSFRIEQVCEGEGIPVVLANGFMTDGTEGWSSWSPMISKRYPDSPVFRVHWGAKELKALATYLGSGTFKQVLIQTVKQGASQATKAGAKVVSGLGAMATAAELAANPWHVAVRRADKTGAALAAILAHSKPEEYVLVGHSLGARVMALAVQSLATAPASPRIRDAHLLGAAVAANRDWKLLNDGIENRVINYYSRHDKVLKLLYQVAQAGSRPAGLEGINSGYERIVNRDVSAKVKSHSGYFTGFTLE